MSVSPQPASSNSQFTVGALITGVGAGSAADTAGLQQGDLITSVAALTVQDDRQLTAAAREQPAGAVVTITHRRNGKRHQTSATLGTAPAN